MFMMQKNITTVVRFFVFGIFVVALVGGIFYFGYRLGVRNPEKIIVTGITNIGDPEATADFGTFWEARKILKDYYVDAASIKDQNFVYGAIAGMVGSLKDPNTIFLPPEESKKFEEDIRGVFGGIGAEIGIKNDQLVIIAPLKGSPAERAGLKSADKILKVNATSTVDMNVIDAVKIIRGEVGTKVTLTILRNGWEKPKEFTITRETILVPTLDWEIKEGNIAHVRLHNFNPNAVNAFYRAAVELFEKNISGMVLDVRNNPGGFLESAITLAGFFLEKDKVVAIQRFSSGKEDVFKTRGPDGVFRELPLVVLINQGSASASEILAGALRVHRGVKLVGEKSFGKGTIQELHELHDKSRIKVTIANWLLPDGHLIEKNGITPDIEVKVTEEDAAKGKDAQLEKALEVLKSAVVTQ